MRLRPARTSLTLACAAALLATGCESEDSPGGGGAGSGAGSTTASSSPASAAVTTGAGAPTNDGVEVAWGLRWGGERTDERLSQILVDDDDSILVAGSIGQLDVIDPPLTAVDELDVLLARFDGEGALLAARAIGGFGSDAPRAMARRADGSVLVAGTFAERIDEVDPPLVAFGGPAPFVAAFGPDLGSLWGVALLGAATGQGQLALASFEDGDAGVAGSFDGAMLVGDRVLEAGGPSDGFVMRLEAEGDLAWALQLGGPGVVHLEIGAATSEGDDLVVAAQLEGVLALDGFEVARSEGQRRPVLLRFDEKGLLRAARLLGGEGDAAVGRVVARPGGLLLAVSHDGTFDLPGGVLASAGESDAALLWVDPGGSPLFGERWGDERAQSFGSLLLTEDGSLLAGGSLQGALDFGYGVMKAPMGRPDGFAVELTPAGRPTRSLTVADVPGAEGRSIGAQAVTAVGRFSNGDVAIAGAFSQRLRIGALDLEAKGDLDSFLVRIERW